MRDLLRAIVHACVISLLIPLYAAAEEFGLPEGEVVLTVSGEIEKTNVDDTAQFDMDMLMALESEIIETSTIWTEGVLTFEGVPLHVLIDHLGVSEGVLRASAINDYTIEIPVEDAVIGGPMVAYKLNDALMSVRDKGPLWIVYPYDDSDDYRSEVIYSRSIWQLDRIEFVR
ncbi:oxidoreductase [Loktanella sp. S4079]|uniref:oxidoreductase n=1 Tax=Loktanella sp. S4079 TaxID=579483 RepID=UPI0005FA7B15|nr:oxidoreductase [Loktanella sp. S4079]KJZ21033.1 oxidoreductase [Loktanella sp. S4079]